MNRDKNKVIFVIKSPGLGDLQILLSNIHHIYQTSPNGPPRAPGERPKALRGASDSPDKHQNQCQ